MATVNITVTATDQTVTGTNDGTLSFELTTDIAATSYTYSITKDGVTTSDTSTNTFYTFGGLAPGIYRCIAIVDTTISNTVNSPVASASSGGGDGPPPTPPPTPIVYEYQNRYEGSFCDKRGNNIVAIFRKKVPVGSIIIPSIEIQFAGENDGPIVIDYPDNGDYKLTPVNGSQCEVKIKAIGAFELSSMYTSDEKEWQLEISGAYKWIGFVIPDSCIEPFVSKPYDVSIRATDAVGLLKDIPFEREDLVKYKGFYSDKEILRLCLAKTELDLKMLIAVNTYEGTMEVNNVRSPMGQSYANTEPFLNEDGTAMDCYTIMESILKRWSARLHQHNGVWQIVNIMEKSLGAVNTFQFNSSGFTDGAAYNLGNFIRIGGQDRPIRPMGDSLLAKAFKQSSAYYKYGYIGNILPNGNFDIWTSKPSGLPDNWVTVGVVTASTGIRYQDGFPTSDYFLVVGGSGTGRVENDTSIQILKGDFPKLTFDLSAPTAWGNNVSDIRGRFLSVLLQASNGMYFTASGWKMTFGYYTIKYNPSEFNKDLQVTINLTPLEDDYLLKVGLLALGLVDGTHFDTKFNNVNLNGGVGSAAEKNPIGETNLQISLTKQSFIPDRIELLHSDDTNIIRTSGLRISATNDGTLINPDSAQFSSLWKRSGIIEYSPLLRIVANTELRLHQRAYRIIEFEYIADFTSPDYVVIDINTVVAVDLLAGNFIFLSGSFDLKTGRPRLKFAEVLTEELTVNETLKMDYDN